MAKPRLYNEEDGTKAATIQTLKTVLIQAPKLLRPFIPFVSEEIFCNLQEEEETIMVSRWFVYRQDQDLREEEGPTEAIKEVVQTIRGVRTSINVPPSERTTVCVVSEGEGLLPVFEHGRSFFATPGYMGKAILQRDKTGIIEDVVSAMLPKVAIYMPFAKPVGIEKEVERLRAEEKCLTGELVRPNGMLNNGKFVSRAPKTKITEEETKLEKYTRIMEWVETRLAQLQKWEKCRTEREDEARLVHQETIR